MAVAYATQTNLAYASHTNSTLTKPTGTVEGDLLVSWFILGAAAPPTPTLPAGWAAVPGFTNTSVTNGGFTVVGRLIYKVAGGSEPTTYSITHTAASSAATVIRITGAGASPKFVVASASGGSETYEFPSVTTEAVESLIAIFGHDWGDKALNLTAPTGTTPTFTERLDTTLNYCATGILAGKEATGLKTMTNNSSSKDPWGVATLAIAPAEVGGEALIKPPAAAAVASAIAAVPLVKLVTFIAQAVAGAPAAAPSVAPAPSPAAAEARGPAPAPEVRPLAPSGGALGSSAAPTPAVTPASPPAAAEARGPAPAPEVRPLAPPAAAAAAGSAPVPIIRPISVIAGALAAALSPIPEVRPMSPGATAIAGAVAPISEIRATAPSGGAVAAGLTPVITTIGALIPSYWQARARILLNAARALFFGGGAVAVIAATPTATAKFTPPNAQATFANSSPGAKFDSGRAVADIGDPDPTATIVT